MGCVGQPGTGGQAAIQGDGHRGREPLPCIQRQVSPGHLVPAGMVDAGGLAARILDACRQHIRDGDACLEVVKKGFQGVILMDANMPDKDGLETIQSLIDEELISGNIVCMLTGNDKPDERIDEFKSYVLDYVRKPFDSEKLVSMVKRYLSYL